MTASVYDESKLPEFTAGVNSGSEFEFLHRNHAPRFVAIVDFETDPLNCFPEVQWIDPAPADPFEQTRILREAADWWAEEEQQLPED